MKKNISINLFGTLYNIDEDAYNLLESYLQSMQRYFSRQEGGEEIADDIEHRVAELLWQKREAGMTAIDINVVKEIIDTIGNAEQIAGEGGSKSERAGAYNKQETSFKEDFKHFSEEAGKFASDTYDRGRNHVRTHRFYRCADDKVLGGVCSGAAIYFNAGEPLIWRLGVIALTLLVVGLPLIVLYVVLWLVTPVAITPEDRLRQRGMEITPNSLAQQVKDDSEPVVVKGENKGCLISCLVVVGICILLPFIFIISIWGKVLWEMFCNF